MHTQTINECPQTQAVQGWTSRQKIAGLTVALGLIALIAGSALVSSDVSNDLKVTGSALAAVGGSITFVFLFCVARHLWSNRKSLQELREADEKQPLQSSPVVTTPAANTAELPTELSLAFPETERDIILLFGQSNNHSRHYLPQFNTTVTHLYNLESQTLTPLKQEDAIILSPKARATILRRLQLPEDADPRGEWGKFQSTVYEGNHFLVNCHGIILLLTPKDAATLNAF